MQKRKIIIDTDPGQDDAVAILLALASPKEIEVLGITAVAGNVPLYLTEKNARIVCELANNTDVKVFAGCDTPMNRPLAKICGCTIQIFGSPHPNFGRFLDLLGPSPASGS